jgi:hypothetical protein
VVRRCVLEKKHKIKINPYLAYERIDKILEPPEGWPAADLDPVSKSVNAVRRPSQRFLYLAENYKIHLKIQRHPKKASNNNWSSH